MAFLDVSRPDDPDNPAVVVLSGEFDMSNADALMHCLASFDDHDVVVLDLAAVTFMDSTAIATLAISLQRHLRLSIRDASDFARRVLSVSGLADLLEDAETVSDGTS